MAKEKYLVIYPNSTIRWVEIERSDMLHDFYKVIGCDSLENVRTIIPDMCLIVDECGKIKDPPQRVNEVASFFYAGSNMGYDPIVGPAILASIGLVDGEFDWIPLEDRQLEVLRLLGLPIPEA